MATVLATPKRLFRSPTAAATVEASLVLPARIRKPFGGARLAAALHGTDGPCQLHAGKVDEVLLAQEPKAADAQVKPEVQRDPQRCKQKKGI